MVDEKAAFHIAISKKFFTSLLLSKCHYHKAEAKKAMLVRRQRGERTTSETEISDEEDEAGGKQIVKRHWGALKSFMALLRSKHFHFDQFLPLKFLKFTGSALI